MLTETGIIHPTVIAPVLQNTGAGNTPSPSVTEGGSRPDTGGISVRSNPAGAEILLDGTDTGDVTPFMLRDIHPGDYVVTLSLTGYDPANMSVTVRADETAIVSKCTNVITGTTDCLRDHRRSKTWRPPYRRYRNVCSQSRSPHRDSVSGELHQSG